MTREIRGPKEIREIQGRKETRWIPDHKDRKGTREIPDWVGRESCKVRKGLTGPRGRKGDKRDKGDTGPQGPQASGGLTDAGFTMKACIDMGNHKVTNLGSPTKRRQCRYEKVRGR